MQKVIIVYNDRACSSYLWVNSGIMWFLFPFEDMLQDKLIPVACAL